MRIRLIGTILFCQMTFLVSLATPASAGLKDGACPVGDASCVEIQDEASLSAGQGADFFQDYPKPYCSDPKFPNTVSYSLKYYLMDNGQQYPISPDGQEIWPVLEDISMMDLRLEPGDVHLYERWHTHCEGVDEAGNAVMDKAIEFWMPLVTVDSIVYQVDLVAKVVDQLGPPVVEFVDADIEHGWLYVNVDHHVALQKPETVRESAPIENPTGKAEAWVEGWPAGLTLELPGESGVEGLAGCDLKNATTTGCEIKFPHSSSIAKGGKFTGIATLYWGVRSNSGKYDLLGPFTTKSEFSIEVAEAMAVTEERPPSK